MKRKRLLADGKASKAHTFAEPVVEADTSEAAWLAERRKGVGASELASVLGLPGAYSSPFATWWAKQLSWESAETFEMHVGSKLEPVIGELFAEQWPHLTVVRPTHRMWRHPSVPWLTASPDFIVIDESTNTWQPLECKSDQGRKWDEVPLKHTVQVYAQCSVLGADSGLVVRLNGKKMTIHPVDFLALDAATWEGWLSLASKFVTSLEAGVPPEPDGHDETAAALGRLYPTVADEEDDQLDRDRYLSAGLAQALRDAHAKSKQAQADYQQLRNTALYELAGARYGLDEEGKPVVRRSQYKRDTYTVPAQMIDELRLVN